MRIRGEREVQKFKMALEPQRGTTGDMKNNVLKLLREIKRMKLQIEPDTQGWISGEPASFLPVLHSALMHYSLPLANWLMSQGYDLYGKSDLRFLGGMYLILRDVFNYRPKLSKQQFLTTGFAERKVILTYDLLLLCQAKNLQLTAKGKRRLLSVLHKRSKYTAPEVLTIRQGPGVGSVWSEQVAVHVERPYGDQTPSPLLGIQKFPVTHYQPAPPIPYIIKEAGVLESELDVTLTPTSTATRPQQTTPPPSSPLPPPLPYASPSSLQSLEKLPEPLSKGATHTNEDPLPVMKDPRKRDDDLESWKSLPLLQSHEQEVDQEEVGRGRGAGNQSPLFKQLSAQVEQLTCLVEKMSARFVLVETQLMLAEANRTEISQIKSSHEPRDGCYDKTPSHDQPHAPVNTRKPPLQHVTTTPTKPPLQHHLQPPITTPPKPPLQHPAIHLQPAITPELQPTPHSASLSTNLSRSESRDHATRCTSPSWKYSILTTPTTPEETEQLIKNLRSRAHKTRLFLQEVTSRHSRDCQWQ